MTLSPSSPRGRRAPPHTHTSLCRNNSDCVRLKIFTWFCYFVNIELWHFTKIWSQTKSLRGGYRFRSDGFRPQALNSTELLAAQGWICELHEESSDRRLHVQCGRERSWCAAFIQNRGEWEWWGGYWPLRRWMWLGKNRILFLLTGYATSFESVIMNGIAVPQLHLPGMAIKGSASALDMQKQLYYMQSVTKTLNTWERHYWPRLLQATWNQCGWDGWRLMKGEGCKGTCTPQWGHPVIYKVVRKQDKQGKTSSKVQLPMLYLGMKINAKIWETFFLLVLGCGIDIIYIYIHI